MTNEEKIDRILDQLEANKNQPKIRDSWDKVQIVSSTFTGIVALVLTIINLSVTRSLSQKANDQADSLRVQQRRLQERELLSKSREETLEEIKILPSLVAMRTSREVELQNLANAILDRLKQDPIWKDQLLQDYAKTPKDTKPNAREIDSLTTQPATRPSFWVYLGQKINGGLQPKNFDRDEMPNKGAVITSLTSVFERASEPKNDNSSVAENWYLGKPVGVLKPHERVKVLETMILAGENYWARVQFP